MVPEQANVLWVSDITYIRIGRDFAYLSLITDAYSRKIIGFCVSHDLSTDSCLKALKMALATRPKTGPGLTHHSDRGTQYCSQEYTRLLISKGIGISMTESGDPRDNAIAERINGILKTELLKESYEDINSAYQSIKQAISIYNNLRPHSSIDMLTPQTAHDMTGLIKRRWKNYYPAKTKSAVTV